MDPYEILGLQYPCSKEEIKNRYYELAKKHHPDKLQHLSQEERDKNEQEFKKINVAYELLTKQEFEYTTKTEWKSMWANVDDFISNKDLLKNMGDVLKKVYESVREYKKKQASDHYITVDVTLEEVHMRKEKKLRLFLKKMKEPVFIYVDCGCYPSFMYTHITPDERTLFIHITFNLLPHTIFYMDTVFDTMDLSCNVHISWYEYIYGCKKQIKYLDGTYLTVELEPFTKDSIIIEGKGLYGKDHLNIFVVIEPPEKGGWESWEENKKQKLRKYLKELSNAPHNGVKSI